MPLAHSVSIHIQQTQVRLSIVANKFGGIVHR